MRAVPMSVYPPLPKLINCSSIVPRLRPWTGQSQLLKKRIESFYTVQWQLKRRPNCSGTKLSASTQNQAYQRGPPSSQNRSLTASSEPTTSS